MSPCPLCMDWTPIGGSSKAGLTLYQPSHRRQVRSEIVDWRLLLIEMLMLTSLSVRMSSSPWFSYRYFLQIPFIWRLYFFVYVRQCTILCWCLYHAITFVLADRSIICSKASISFESTHWFSDIDQIAADALYPFVMYFKLGYGVPDPSDRSGNLYKSRGFSKCCSIMNIALASVCLVS